MPEPELTPVAALEAVYRAKAEAELTDADAVAAAAGVAARWSGPVLGSRIAFIVGGTIDPAADGPLDAPVADAVSKVAVALGADGCFATVASSPSAALDADARARRLRGVIEALDTPVVVAIDEQAAGDLAAAFGIDVLPVGGAIRAFGRTIGNAGDLGASLGDPSAKARVWSALKSIGASGGLETKGRPKAPQVDRGVAERR